MEKREQDNHLRWTWPKAWKKWLM